MRVLADTNILLRSAQPADPLYSQARGRKKSSKQTKNESKTVSRRNFHPPKKGGFFHLKPLSSLDSCQFLPAPRFTLAKKTARQQSRREPLRRNLAGISRTESSVR